ncbi:DUF4825 domain-containing protein [Priestia koreensis]|uniref:DUF4825 domain-containing protein n=1 Tax=Priestia koreensis TaxID=284581 RepID=A0A0M0KVR8_9BACI|nr:DUF4825 domain-containing protein [Priestia koreensis]KOO42914.1 hypothetical protein AMD01_17385 [Priestia koreensis]
MKKLSVYVLTFVSVILFVSGCSQSETEKSTVFKYKDSYVGNNSAVINITKQLKHGKELKEISLQTQKKPYGVTLDYKKMSENVTEKELKDTAISNATFLFALIKNVDTVTFKFPNQDLTVSRAKLEDWYDVTLGDYKKEEELRKLIKKQLKSDQEMDAVFS